MSSVDQNVDEGGHSVAMKAMTSHLQETRDRSPSSSSTSSVAGVSGDIHDVGLAGDQIDNQDDGDDTSPHPFSLLAGEIIKTVEEDVKLANYQGSDRNSIGTLYITNFRLYFKSMHNDLKVSHSNFYSVDPAQVIIDLPLGCVSKVEKFGGAVRGSEKYGLEILCKDFRSVRLQLKKSKVEGGIVSLGSTENSYRKNLFECLQQYCFPATYHPDGKDSLDGKKSLFAFSHGPAVGLLPPDQNGWNIFDPQIEFERLGVPNQNWRIMTDNSSYSMSDTYPAIIAVPACLKLETILQVAKYRSKGRLPALSWINKETQASITRCSQPTTGVGGRRCEADEAFIAAIMEKNSRTTGIWVADARPRANAIANKAKGGGFESVDAYKNMELVFLDIHNIHVMRESLRKVREMCWPRLEEVRWLSSLENTRWLEHLRQVLAGAARVAHKVDSDKTSVLVHCSDGWDRTAQLTSLAMILLDPYFRTLRGIQVLIEKEWCAFGHKFAQRIGHGEDKHSDPERSPVFLQFIDCVWQLTNIFTPCFEFNECFLIEVLDALYSCRFGTFLCNSERERSSLSIRESTASIWTMINKDRLRYINPLYNPNLTQVLKPKPTLRSLQLWLSYYGRYNQALRQQEPVEERLMQLLDLKERLRKRIQEEENRDRCQIADDDDVLSEPKSSPGSASNDLNSPIQRSGSSAPKRPPPPVAKA